MSLDHDVIKYDIQRAQQYPQCGQVRTVVNTHAPAMLAELEECHKRERQLALERNQFRRLLHQATFALDGARRDDPDMAFIRSTMVTISQLGIHPDDYEKEKALRLSVGGDPDAKL
jgi:hypothetical protein